MPYVDEPIHVRSKNFTIFDILETHRPFLGNSRIKQAVDPHKPSLKYMPLHVSV